MDEMKNFKKPNATLLELATKATFCKSCGKPLMWIKTLSGKFMPCDMEPKSFKYRPRSTTKLVRPDGVVVNCEVVNNPEDADGYGYVPHWSTCNAADKFRKRDTK
jgi:RNase P subunit RPR2